MSYHIAGSGISVRCVRRNFHLAHFEDVICKSTTRDIALVRDVSRSAARKLTHALRCGVVFLLRIRIETRPEHCDDHDGRT